MELKTGDKLEEYFDSKTVRGLFKTSGQPLSSSTFDNHCAKKLIIATMQAGKRAFSADEIEKYRLRLQLRGEQLSRERSERMRRVQPWKFPRRKKT